MSGKGKDITVDLLPTRYTLKKVPHFQFRKREKRWYVNGLPLVAYVKGAPLTCQIRRGRFVIEF